MANAFRSSRASAACRGLGLLWGRVVKTARGPNVRSCRRCGRDNGGRRKQRCELRAFGTGGFSKEMRGVLEGLSGKGRAEPGD